MAPEQPPARRRAALPRVLLALFVLLALYLYQAGRLQAIAAYALEHAGLAHSEPRHGPIQAFFTTPALVYPDLAQQRRSSALLDAVLADLDAARSSVDLASFDFDIPSLTDALLRAAKRGVMVRVLVDSENLEAPEVSEQTGRLQRAGIAVQFDRREPFMHDKFLVIDQAIAWTGSWNLTDNDTWRNNNQMLRFISRRIAADYINEFEQMFAGRFGTSKRSATPYPQVRLGSARVAVYFSPQDGVAKHVLQRIAAAKRSIHFMTFSYTSSVVADAMVAQAQAGLPVRGVFERQNAGGTGSAFSRLRQGGVDVLEDGNCYILHHKVIIIDERTVITGSYNFTNSAERDNDENLVIVDDPNSARAYLEEFERVYAQAQAPTRCR
ncbi:MAG TPA: phospholipase D-like domain-containing protein [Roseiflexaceae bacterium]|nr:phospholipase D-like domain-containing protein [Roseiflexaceae bacterium]